jgi:hypothetical protein
VQTGKRNELPRGMSLVTRVFASSEHAWDPMASSSVKFCQKTRTVPPRRDHSTSAVRLALGTFGLCWQVNVISVKQGEGLGGVGCVSEVKVKF